MEVIALDFPYGPQDPSYCLISLSNNHERIVSFVTICGTIDGNQTTMTLRSIPSQDVESAYLVVQHAVGELFGGEMQAELVYEAASCLNIAFSLEFVAQMEYKNYDDYSSTLPFQLPSKYNFIWPKLLDITQIIDSIKRGMSTVIGTHGSLVLFEHLNFVLVFSLNIQNIPLDQKAVIHEISTEYLLSVDITSSVNSSPQIRISPLLLTYMSEPMNIIQSSLFNMSSAHSYHSIAITGRHGAGKTTLLNWLDNECYKLHYRCIRIDARQLQVISRDMEMELLSLVHALSLHASNHSNSVVHLIIRALFVLSTLSYTKHNGNTHQDILLSELSLINESTVLAIDNADCLADDEEGKLLISLLQHLMQIISNTYTTTQLSYNLLIILTSSTPLILLPYAERTCELGRPSLQDRHQLIHSFLELFDVEREDNSIDWSDSISRLTSGYLPGDIRQIIDRSRALSAGSVVIWADVLNAVATVVPEQMKGISRLLHSSGCSSTSLCWADYAGYDTVKKRVFHVLSQLQLTSHTSQHSKRDNNNKLSMCMNNQNGGIVLHGLSGNGKTFLASIIASEIRVNFLHVRCTELLSKYYGETEANIRSVFKSAVAPCLLFLDEFDVFAHKRYALPCIYFGYVSLLCKSLLIYMYGLN